ncbi:MAG: CBS domain-containing protein [Planctomycetia bacterium]|jgi:CBS domain-containing protein|nr:CBS domain-containing protein [Planctomycetia bacterium]
MATVASILAGKSSYVHSIGLNATILEATQKMNDHRIGSLLVMEGERIVGILSERDILTRVVVEEKPPRAVKVREAMTTDVVVVGPDTSLEEASAVMRTRRVRHLPVCDADGRLLGLISIGDLNARHASDQEITIRHLHEYLYGPA